MWFLYLLQNAKNPCNILEVITSIFYESRHQNYEHSQINFNTFRLVRLY